MKNKVMQFFFGKDEEPKENQEESQAEKIGELLKDVREQMAENHDVLEQKPMTPEQKEIKTLKSRIDFLVNEISDSQSKFDSIDSNVNDLNELVIEVDDIKFDIKNIQEEQKTLVKDVDDLKTNIISCIDLITSLNNGIEKLQNTVESTQEYTTNEIAKQANKLTATTEVLLEKISVTKVERDLLPKILSKDICPFKPNQGYCDIWANRPDKNDGLVFCQSCIRASELASKGVKL